MKNIVKIKKLYPNTIIPSKQTIGAACYDLHINNYKQDKDNIVIGFGFATEITPGWKGLIVPRSSFTKTPFIMQNNIGIVDSDYRGEWMMKIKVLGEEECEHEYFCTCNSIISIFNHFYKRHERIAQCYFEMIQDVEFEEVKELGESERSINGFGSTGQ